eukprot:sb/3475482/
MRLDWNYFKSNMAQTKQKETRNTKIVQSVREERIKLHKSGNEKYLVRLGCGLCIPPQRGIPSRPFVKGPVAYANFRGAIKYNNNIIIIAILEKCIHPTIIIWVPCSDFTGARYQKSILRPTFFKRL